MRQRSVLRGKHLDAGAFAGAWRTRRPLPSICGTSPAPLIARIASRIAIPVTSGTRTASFAGTALETAGSMSSGRSPARIAASVASARSPVRVTAPSLADAPLGVTPR
jgi:hypothetical protein